MDSLGPQGARFWLRLDSTRRPHRLYLGEGFYNADADSQKWFVEVFSRYLSGRPDKETIIDLFDADTGRLVGEYGWQGFRLYADGRRATEKVRREHAGQR